MRQSGLFSSRIDGYQLTAKTACARLTLIRSMTDCPTEGGRVGRGGGSHGHPLEPMVAAACADPRARHHGGRVRGRDRLDHLHEPHPLAAVRRVRDRLVRMGPPVRAAVQGRRLDHLAPEPRHPRHRLDARHRLRLHPRGADRSRKARRGLLPDRLPLSARRVADRHRRRVALDLQPQLRASRPSSTASG